MIDSKPNLAPKTRSGVADRAGGALQAASWRGRPEWWGCADDPWRVAFVTGAGVEGTLKIMQRLEDKDTLIVTVELPEPVTFKMVRKTNQTEGQPGSPPQ